VIFKNKTFDVIYVGGERTSITTDMGFDWELWQALREIYANAIDEGLLFFDFVDEINPENGSTHFYIEADDAIEDFMFNLQDYFAINKQVVYENEVGKIYRKHNSKTCIYRKGIRCYETTKPSLFDYDFNDIEVTEDRIVKYSWSVGEQMWQLLASCSDKRVAYEILNNITKDDYLEKEIDNTMVSATFVEFDKSWAEPLNDKHICPINMSGYVKDEDRPKTFFLPNELYSKLTALTKGQKEPDNFRVTGSIVYKEIDELDDHKATILSKIYDFICDAGLDVQYKWRVVSFGNKDIHGTIDKKNELILLADTIFEHGQHYILNVILEEYIHLKYNAEDETRKFQESMLNEFVAYMSKINNVSL
jgi:hypothetical protein